MFNEREISETDSPVDRLINSRIATTWGFAISRTRFKNMPNSLLVKLSELLFKTENLVSVNN
jgi:hypothetical protein